MTPVSIHPSTYQFLDNLTQNNNREWFNANKELYRAAYLNVCDFVEALIFEMNTHDEIETKTGKKSLYRIYNDVRFSKDKSPYIPRFAFSLRRATKWKRGGYYLNLKPGNSYLACGFFAPNPADLMLIRKDIKGDFEHWQHLLSAKPILANFGSLKGNQVPTLPRGFDKNHPGIHLIRNKQFIWRHDFSDEEVVSVDFLVKVNQIFKAIRPIFNHMSEVLTSNANGEKNNSLK